MDLDICSSSVLTPAGWLSPARIRMDEHGFVREVSRLEGPRTDQPLSGPVVPGMPNLHSHAFQRQLAGLTQTASDPASGVKDSFWTWRNAMYRLANRITPEQLRSIATWLYAEMLESGFTSCAEFHYLHHQPGGQAYDDPAEMSRILLEAADSAGISLTLLPVLYCRGGFGTSEVTEHQRRFFNSPEGFLRLIDACLNLVRNHPLHLLGIAPHSLRAVSVEQMREVLGEPAHEQLPIHIHIAEQLAEVEECRTVLGARPAEWLLDTFPVDRRWCLVHATHLESRELDRAAASGATAGLCPTTEADLGDGLFAAESWLAAGGGFGIGSDSNLRISLAEELRLLEFGCRLRNSARNVLADRGLSCGRNLYQRAAAGGAAATRQPVGRIEPGLRADLVELDMNHPLLEGRKQDSILDTWLFAGGSSMVRSVWVAGKLVVNEGRHPEKCKFEAPFRRAMKELL
jgi:formimidoylglutamate deiminase